VSDNKPFVDRFLTREEVLRYRDRYVTVLPTIRTSELATGANPEELSYGG
jgi:hypothetical protein